ncbi:MAG: F0F1 ATP synthase subunit delta [Pseudomonadota bacterium]|nr:F0F1 ATP synthase subunit delta [Pseudomonadota bacterium]
MSRKGDLEVVANSQSLAGRYASALYELADKDHVLDAIAEDLVKFRQLMVESEDLNRLIRSPVISRSDQNNGLMAILENAKAKPLTKKFIGAVVMNRRIFVVADIIDVFLSELAERRGEIKATVVSAVELSAKQLKDLTGSLNKALGQKVSIDLTVDTSLIGGLIVRVGSRMIDSSIRSKLQRLQIAMKGMN